MGSRRQQKTYHDLSAFEQGDLEVKDLHVHSFDIGGLQVPVTDLVGGAHNKVVLAVTGPAGLRQ